METHLCPHLALEREQLFLHKENGTPKSRPCSHILCVHGGKGNEGDFKVGNLGSGF